MRQNMIDIELELNLIPKYFDDIAFERTSKWQT